MMKQRRKLYSVEAPSGRTTSGPWTGPVGPPICSIRARYTTIGPILRKAELSMDKFCHRLACRAGSTNLGNILRETGRAGGGKATGAATVYEAGIDLNPNLSGTEQSRRQRCKGPRAARTKRSGPLSKWCWRCPGECGDPQQLGMLSRTKARGGCGTLPGGH